MPEIILPTEEAYAREIKQIDMLEHTEWLTGYLSEMGMVVSPHEVRTLRPMAEFAANLGEQMVRSRLKQGLILQTEMPTDKYMRLRYQFQMDLAQAYAAMEATGSLVGSAPESERLLMESEKQVDQLGLVYDKIPLRMRKGEVAYLQGTAKQMRSADHPEIMPKLAEAVRHFGEAAEIADGYAVPLQQYSLWGKAKSQAALNDREGLAKTTSQLEAIFSKPDALVNESLVASLQVLNIQAQNRPSSFVTQSHPRVIRQIREAISQIGIHCR